jgi:CO/xanthine dehydrogenase FAD-binding subunit
MFTITEVSQPETIEEAYTVLTHRRSNAVLGGCAFLRMGSQRIGTAVDLSKLSLNYIREDVSSIEIGAMASFRDLETYPGLRENFGGIVPKAVSHVIGVQFRNVVTVGASVFSKYGFSDLITALLALETEVELCKGGRMPLRQFLTRPFERDILTRIFIRKNSAAAAYQTLRNSASDYPVLNVAVSGAGDCWTVAVGARPNVAAIAGQASDILSQAGTGVTAAVDAATAAAAQELSFGTNARGSAEYRRAMCKELVKRAIMEVLACR